MSEPSADPPPHDPAATSPPAAGSLTTTEHRPPAPLTEYERAISALRNLASPKPHANAHPESESPPEDPRPMSGASGFVGMLARKGVEGDLDNTDDIGSSRDFTALQNSERQARRAKYQIPMAREVTPPEGHEIIETHPVDPTMESQPDPDSETESDLIEPVESLAPAPPKPPPGLATTLTMFLLAVILLAIGIWAAGALVYMHSVKPNSPGEVHYPLIRWSYDTTGVGEALGGYTQMSRVMAISMIVCLPIALLMAILGGLLLRRR